METGSSKIETSQTLFDFSCSLCSDDGKNIKALYQCVACRMYFCQGCQDNHDKFINNHNVFDRNSAKFGQAQAQLAPHVASRLPIDVCEEHRGEVIKMYCGQHDVVCCPICILIKHRSCIGVEHITNISKGLLQTTDKERTETSLEKIRTDLENLKSEMQNDLSVLQKDQDSIIADIQKSRERIVAVAAELEQKSLGEVQTNLKMAKDDIDGLSGKIDVLLEDIVLRLNNLKASETGDEAQLLLDIKYGEKQLSEAKKIIDTASSSSITRSMEFDVNLNISKSLLYYQSLGTLTVHKRTTNAEPTGNSLNYRQTAFKQSQSGTISEHNPPRRQDIIAGNKVTQNINAKHQDITAMKVKEERNLKELSCHFKVLTVEDDTVASKGRPILKARRRLGTSAVSSEQLTGGAFGQNKPARCETTNSGSKQSSGGLFGATTFEEPQSTTAIKFKPPVGRDTIEKHIKTRHICITAMKEYVDKSLEELRAEDYNAGRKGKQAGTGRCGLPTSSKKELTGFTFGKNKPSRRKSGRAKTAACKVGMFENLKGTIGMISPAVVHKNYFQGMVIKPAGGEKTDTPSNSTVSTGDTTSTFVTSRATSGHSQSACVSIFGKKPESTDISVTSSDQNNTSNSSTMSGRTQSKFESCSTVSGRKPAAALLTSGSKFWMQPEATTSNELPGDRTIEPDSTTVAGGKKPSFLNRYDISGQKQAIVLTSDPETTYSNKIHTEKTIVPNSSNVAVEITHPFGRSSANCEPEPDNVLTSGSEISMFHETNYFHQTITPNNCTVPEETQRTSTSGSGQRGNAPASSTVKPAGTLCNVQDLVNDESKVDETDSEKADMYKPNADRTNIDETNNDDKDCD